MVRMFSGVFTAFAGYAEDAAVLEDRKRAVHRQVLLGLAAALLGFLGVLNWNAKSAALMCKRREPPAANYCDDTRHL